MKETVRQPAQHKVAGILLLVMILATTLAGLGLGDFLWLSGGCALTALALLWSRMRRVQRIQCFIFLGVGLLTLIWAWLAGYREIPVLQLMTQNHLLISLLSAVSFLRLITDASKEDHNTVQLGFRAFLKTLAGLHLFASVINLSALIIFGDRLSRHGRLERTAATSIQRSFSLASLWSPFFAAMGTCLLYAPGARLADLWGLSVPLCLFGFAFTLAEHRFRRGGDLEAFEGYPVNFRALWVPLIMVICVLLAHRALPSVSVLVLVSALSLVVTTAVLAWRQSLSRSLSTIRDFSCNRLPDMYGELALFLCAGIMATGLSVLVSQTAPELGIDAFTSGAAIAVLAILLTLAIIGVHALISIVATSAILAPLNPDPILLALVFIVTWSVGATGGPISGLNLAMQSRYNVKAWECFTWNIAYTLAMFTGTSVLILAAFA
ncbi:MAG: hypothetical protein CL395_03875 [Acidiferrobacteraceae bacterium]|nr:hypothetical protein [Acidiferrobacteraceae bacterium]HJP07012.1 hypothetical protein [Arenicellales bacterium]